MHTEEKEKYVHKDTGKNRPSSWAVDKQMEVMNEPDITKATK